MANHTQAQTVQGVTRGVAYCRFRFDDLVETDTSEVISWATLVAAHPDGASNVPPNSRITYAHARLIEVFAGGDVTAVTITLGDAGAATEQMTALNVFTGQALGLKPKTGAYAGAAIEAAYAPILTVATSDGNLDELESGEIEFALHYESITTDPQVRM